MELLFEKTGGTSGSTELKKLLGFIDADLNFAKIKPDIITSTRELTKLIGKDTYNSVVEIYKDAAATQEQLQLVYYVQYPIAIKAYMLLAPSNDIAHTNNGRKMRQDTNEKQAFEWMLDRDNVAMERRYYRALDDLLEYLDENVEAWKETEAYTKTHKLFIRTAAEFNEYFRIDSRLTLLQLEPGIRQCEQNEILPRIGKDRFNALKELVKNGNDINEETDVQLLSLVREACAYHSLSWAMMRLSVHLFPEGVLQAYTSDRNTTKASQVPVKSEAEAARQAFASDAQTIFNKIEKLLQPVPPVGDTTIIPDVISGCNFIST